MTDSPETEQDSLFESEAEDLTSDQSDALDVSVAERRLVTQPYDLSLATLAEDIKQGQLLLSIQYQRKYVWDRSKASRLIESFLLNIPVPVCYFAENPDGTYEVIDGLQRIQTVNDFLADEFSLRGISVLKEHEGQCFSDLPPREQRRLTSRTVRCIVITDDSHPDIKFDVFERLNTGSAMLGAQELRNCIYRGGFNFFLKELAADYSFKEILGGIKNNRMDHEELALRFFALHEELSTYRPPLRQFLNSYMRKYRADTPSDEHMAVFTDTCRAVFEIFGADAFRVLRDGKLGAFNKALYDSIVIPLSFADRDAAVAKAEEVRALREELLRNEGFQTAIGRATADRTRMHGRIRMFAEGLNRLEVSCVLPPLPEL
ncbi:DUF262 domain-containing protein [Streptomyces sp. NPDC013082]|uniref:DUF262 domain-containing protein n=1 Tax=Streptomyces sp. NPDC013082 TaxID=3156686 RepID=UPI003401A131